MSTSMTVKGQVTVPKRIRDALGLKPGSAIDFRVNPAGEVVLCKAHSGAPRGKDRFETARGKAQIKWRTDELMAMLRND